jgi:hypothetical protein
MSFSYTVLSGRAFRVLLRGGTETPPLDVTS